MRVRKALVLNGAHQKLGKAPNEAAEEEEKKNIQSNITSTHRLRI